ncbi:MAG: hypothetical protein K2H60_00020 [Muribaculaceae bacterium]|nr:hypothetical protein [Muribaculaceae bacterium]
MKKTLLLSAFAVFATVASAQTIIGLSTPDDVAAAGIVKEKATIPGGTILVDNEAGTFGLAYEDSWGSTGAGKTYKTVKVGDSDDIYLPDYQGAVGNSNPTFVSYEEGVMSAGAVFQIDAKMDGWMTVFTNINPNKQYLVFENKTGALPYTLGVAGADYKINYSLPVQTSGDDEGYIDFNAPDAGKYFIAATKQAVNEAGVKLWEDADGNIVAQDTKPDGGKAVMEEIPGQNKPQFPWIIAGFDKAPGEGTGFMTFNVLAGNTYYFSALGSKCAGIGFVFTDSLDEPAVTYCAQDDLPEVVFATATAVESIAAAIDENAPIYNAQGIRVNADAKGLLIQNGKKFIRK